MENILNEIRAEMQKQNEKWGVQDHSVIEWQAILMEEVGEVAKEAVDFHFETPIIFNHWSLTTRSPSKLDQQNRLISYRTELIQVAAVAVQMIKCLDRHNPDLFINHKNVRE